LCAHIREPPLLVRKIRFFYWFLSVRRFSRLEDGGNPISYEELKLIVVALREYMFRL
jgi:hypothetical protein